jgi:hypothetical protein
VRRALFACAAHIARRTCSMWSLKTRPNCSDESSGGFGAGVA